MTKKQNTSRPLVHFTPPQNWMNDPNGLVYVDGEYHLFYQHNPYATNWGHMSWGHAVSPDLVHWQHLPVAIWEDTEAGFTIFSGSAVIDKHNTSGFGESAMVAIYTADYALPEKIQDIHIAYSTDNGRSFQQYDQNPVIATGEAKFGDPKVFWYPQESKWIMVNICHRPQGHIEFYSSTNLKEWGYMSSFADDQAAPGIWECPDLFPLSLDNDSDHIKWVLKVNNTRFGEGPAATRYFVGDFDGKSFSKAHLVGQGLTSDQGAIYAEVTYNDEPSGRRVQMGWLREVTHSERPWTGAMALPRQLTLKTENDEFVLCQQPISEIKTLRQQRVYILDHLVEQALVIETDLNKQVFEAEIVLNLNETQRAGFMLTLDSGQVSRFGYDVSSKNLFYSFENKVITAPFDLPQTCGSEQMVTLRLNLDHAIVELFGDLISALTGTLPFGALYSDLAVFAEGGQTTIKRLDLWHLA